MDLPEFIEFNPGQHIGNAENGRTLYDHRCRACHKASDLAIKSFKEGADNEILKLCDILKTHGRTAGQEDCDLVAFLKVLAERQRP